MVKIITTLISWLASIRLSRILIAILCTLLLVPFFLHYLFSKFESKVQSEQLHQDEADEFTYESRGEMQFRIKELNQIRASMLNKLRNLEDQRERLQNEILMNQRKFEKLKEDMVKQQKDLTKLQISVKQAQLSQIESIHRNSPELSPPLSIIANRIPDMYDSPKYKVSCRRMFNCVDYSRCSLTSGFPVYLYDSAKYFPQFEIPTYLKTLVHQTVGYNSHFTTDAHKACIYIVLVGESKNMNVTLLKSLPYWGGDGRNHVILNLSQRIMNNAGYVTPSLETGKAIIGQSLWNANDFRQNHDMILPLLLGPPGGEMWNENPYMLPARRRYLLSFKGFTPLNDSINADATTYRIKFVHEQLTLATTDEFFMDFECTSQFKNEESATDVLEWHLCKNEKDRASILKASTFTLLPSPMSDSYVSTSVFLVRLFEALKYGAIPLILGSDQIELPFNEVIDWRKVVLSIPLARITEMHWLLRSIPDNDLLLLRRQGRLIYDKYFSTSQVVIDTIIAIIRNRMGIPPLPITDENSISIFPDNFTPLKVDPSNSDLEPEENLGPSEPRYKSPEYKRNFSVIQTQNYEMWNKWMNPFHLFPHLPFDPILPSDAKFIGSPNGFRAINNGIGGAGKEFCESLGGNVPKEQFTVVILTYERNQVLLSSLNRLYGIPYLNKVIIVWNSPMSPPTDLQWPNIGVPIEVLKTKKNSLNNRFIPWNAIETEAVLSIDDDAHLRHDEIIFGFRVWREQRDRIVGFPGRYHALDLQNGGWHYNSNYSCELSMVLTGAAFVHKYYLYMYSYYLPQAIRDTVDEYTNCEDIAMNFLVSHLTRKPPIKITSRWTFRCPGCPVTLSEDETHFNERHKCINFFTKVFGYTPLLYTQFRADSILFKTRIPHDKQKCFKFI